MTKNRILTMTSIVTLTLGFSTLSKAMDYCTETTLKYTPAVLNNGCKLSEFHKTDKGDCFVLYDACKVKLFNPKTNTIIDVTVNAAHGTFENNQNIGNLLVDVIYNYKIGLAAPKPTQSQQ